MQARQLIKDTALIKSYVLVMLRMLLDVFQQELYPKGPLLGFPTTVTPHIAADTPVESSANVLANNIKVLMEGKLPNGMVDLNRVTKS